MTRPMLWLFLSACGASPAQPAVSATTTPSPQPVRDNLEPQAEQAACTQSYDCDIVRNNCGAPTGRRLGDSAPTEHVEHCSPGVYAHPEPSCIAGECVARAVAQPELRECDDTSECIVIQGVCGVPRAVARAKRAEAEEEIERLGPMVDCMGYEGERDLRAECFTGYCITRLPTN